MEPRASVEVYAPVMSRIARAVSHSTVEEGGKFLGRIVRQGENVFVQVESYIDSGPYADNSATHLMPDGAYQEAVFRVAESFDPEIEHIGSWHSHHCCGLDGLSSGDIAGYFKSVNSPDYNLDHFFVLLVTALDGDGARTHCYLFSRDAESYEEVAEQYVRVVQEQSHLEPFLSAAELTTREFRARKRLP